MKKKIKDILVRMIKTFIQGFFATLVVSIQNGEIEVTKSILVGAIAGGISAVMNLIIKLLDKGENYVETNKIVWYKKNGT